MLRLLDGVRVVDMTRLMPGALATHKLADLGADVIKVEVPPVGDYLRGQPPFVDGVGFYYSILNRNKRSLAADPKTEDGRQLILDLVRTADVFVDVSRPGSLARIGLDYESLREVKPDIIHCSLTGYGSTGPYMDLPSHGLNIDAAAGMLKIVRSPNGRPEVKITSQTMATCIEMGGVNAALAITAALWQRTRTGQGQWIDASCWDASVSANISFLRGLNLGFDQKFNPAAVGGMLGPRYNVFGTLDDRVIFLCPIEKRFWKAFCVAVGREEWLERGTWTQEMDLGHDDPTLRDDIEELMRTRTLKDWLDILLPAGVPVSPVLEAADLADNEHCLERGMVHGTGDPRYPGAAWLRPPVRLPGQEFSVFRPAPQLGEHTEEIVAELRAGRTG